MSHQDRVKATQQVSAPVSSNSSPQGATHIIVVLDESGSMADKRNDTIGSYNSFLAEQKKIPGDCILSLVKFNTVDIPVCQRTSLFQVSDLSPATYIPGGGTALLDALGRAINAGGDAKDVIVCVITDGEENSSHSFTKAQIKALVEAKTAQGWNFIYLGAGLNAFGDATAMGFNPNSIVRSLNTAKGMSAAVETMSYAAAKFRSGDKSLLADELVSNYTANVSK